MQISYLLAMVTLYYIITILLKAHLNWLNISVEFHNLLQILLFKIDALHGVVDRHFLELGEQRKLVKLCTNTLQSLIKWECSLEINYEFTTVCILLTESKYAKTNYTIPWNFIYLWNYGHLTRVLKIKIIFPKWMDIILCYTK